MLKAVRGKRPEAAPRCSTREIAPQVGVSHTKVHRILQSHELKPRRVERFHTSSRAPDA